MKSKYYSTKQIHQRIRHVMDLCPGDRDTLKQRLMDEFQYEEKKGDKRENTKI